MAEPWRCPQCLTWVAPHVSEHRCDDGRGSAGATVTPIRPSSGAGSAATVTYPAMVGMGETVTATWASVPGVTAGQVERWKVAARSQGALAEIGELLERSG